MQSVTITTKFVCSNSAYVAGCWFSPGIPVSSINKTDRHDITEILLLYRSGHIYWWRKQEKRTEMQ